jgi:hypothetical protein
MIRLRNVALCSFIVLQCSSCEAREASQSLMVQVCVSRQTDRNDILNLTRDFARRNDLRFYDGSPITTEDELARRAQGAAPMLSVPATNVVVTGRGNFRVVVVNGVAADELILGIGPESMSPQATALISDYLSEVSSRWVTERVPEGQRAQGMRACGGPR